MNLIGEELNRLSVLIGLIYEGATDPSRWTKDILPSIADYFAVPDCILFTPVHTPKDGGYAFMYGRPQELHDRFTSKYQHEDPFTKAAVERDQLVEGIVILGDELVPRQQWLESKVYTECYAGYPNVAKLMLSCVFGFNASHAMASAFTFCRGLRHPDFGEEDRNRLRLVLPHISRSLGVMQRIRSAELAVASSLAALDRLPAGVLLLERSGIVTFANRSAQRMIELGDGLRLSKLSQSTGLGKLVGCRDCDTQAINEAISTTLRRDPYATAHFSKSVLVPRTSGFASYALQFSALGDQNEFGGAGGAFAAIIFIADGLQKMDIDPAALQNVYGLTPSETKVAIALLEYASAKEVANVLSLSPHTVRSQIKIIYLKLGVDTRARFTKLMLGLASCRS